MHRYTTGMVRTTAWRRSRWSVCSFQGLTIGFVILAIAGCGPKTFDDPVTVLRSPDRSPYDHEDAMIQLDVTPDNEAYHEALRRMIWKSGFALDTRRAAFARLEQSDLEGLKRTIRLQLPRMTTITWLEVLCQLIEEHEWRDLSPALVSSWSRKAQVWGPNEETRPEYLALVGLYGEDQVIDLVFEMFKSSDTARERGLRERSWTLLHRLGERERLVELVAQPLPEGSDDGMLLDLQSSARDLGILPRNREEILWIRKLRDPSRSLFWKEASGAVKLMPQSERVNLELRTLPVVVAAARHRPELLAQDTTSLYSDLSYQLDQRKHYGYSRTFKGFRGDSPQRLSEFSEKLNWGDLAAMHIAIEAMSVPQVVGHIFDYADRDKQDKTTEYGGVINLDIQGRFQILEFTPRNRRHDEMFVASQEMFDAGYTSPYHFHLHVQQDDNREFAGPGHGDLNYADNTRTNCLVFTFIDKDTLNVDFYRHSGVVVDLGVIKRP